MKHRFRLLATLLLAATVATPAFAGGPLLIDHKLKYDDSGIWNRNVQLDLMKGAAVFVVGGDLLTDSNTRIGHVFDQSVDSIVLTAVTTSVLKPAFSRARPRDNPDPNDFFQGHGNSSFPSGEVAEISAVVTPFIAEYGEDHPSVWLLSALPAYDAMARMKVNGHWQSDVLAGAAIGAGWGLYAHHRKTPLIIGLLPGHGAMVGYQKQF